MSNDNEATEAERIALLENVIEDLRMEISILQTGLKDIYAHCGEDPVVNQTCNLLLPNRS